MSTKKTQTPKSFLDFVSGKTEDPLLSYDEAVKNVSAQADGASPTRGSLAESIASAGLSKSGYAAYLQNQANAYKAEALGTEAKNYRNSRDSSLKSYREYLNSLRESNEVSFDGVVDAIKKRGTVDEEIAYDYAKGTGLSDDDAKLAAKTATEETLTSLKRKIIAVVQRDGMGREHAIAYAIGQGLPEDLANEIGDYADSWNRLYSKSDSIKDYYGQ